MTDKPRFYLQDLDNYNEDFLKEIILWYDERYKSILGIEDLYIGNHDKQDVSLVVTEVINMIRGLMKR